MGNDITSQIQVDTDLDIKKVGTYKVTYTLTDGVGSTDTAEVVYTVSDTREPYFSGIKRQIQVAPNAAVNVEELLDKVYVIDNNEILSNDRIQVHVPEQLVEGENTVSYSVMDDYGNVATASTLIMVDREPPQLHLYSDAGSILDNSQIVDENFALSRVYATDSGEELPRDSIHVTIYQTDWGYTFVYVATDKSGQTATLTDSVSYVSYTITTTGTLNVTELTAEQLMQGVTLTASTGQTLSGENVQISMNNTISNQYTITYSYTYSSPLGTKTATATRPVILTQQPPMAGPSATPGPGASTPPGPEQTSPAATMEPTNSEDNELISS